MKFSWPVMLLAVAFVASGAWPYLHIGSELMPRLDEGDLLYMPTTDPSVSVTEARQILQQTDKLIKTFPEVLSIYGKIGRAETATDPAPLDMVETVVRLQTDPTKWRKRKMHYWFDRLPDWLTWPLRHTIWLAQRPITMDELVYGWADSDGTPASWNERRGKHSRYRQYLDDADREPHEHALDRNQNTSRHQDHGTRSAGAVGSGPKGIDSRALGLRHHQCLWRAHTRGVLS